MSNEYYDSRQSGGLPCCTVLGNKHKQPVSSDALLSPVDGPNSSLYSDVWHANTHYNASSARNLSGIGFL